MAAARSILIVDDEPALREVMARWAQALGMTALTASSAEEALASLSTRQSEVAVIDVRMPGRDGLWLTRELQRSHPQTAVVLATGYTELMGEANRGPIADFLVKPFARDRFLVAVDRGARWRKQALDDLRWHSQLSRELRDRTDEICAAVRQPLASSAAEIERLAQLTIEHAPDVMRHAERVNRYAQSVARALDVDRRLGPMLAVAARFHDVGKIAMPSSLLDKPSAHTPGEQAIMRRHVEVGAEVLGATARLGEAAPLVLASHEWFDGGGYPLGLAGEQIPLASRIIAVVDAYDAMTQDRAYRTGMAATDAVAELVRCCGRQFDPRVVTALLAVLGRH